MDAIENIRKITVELAEARTLIQTLRGMLTTHVAQLEEAQRQAYADKLDKLRLTTALEDAQGRIGALLLEKAELERQKEALIGAASMGASALRACTDANENAKGYPGTTLAELNAAMVDAGVTL